jgi:putative MFS transporter
MQKLSEKLMSPSPSCPLSPIEQIYEQRLSCGRIQYLYLLILSLIDLNDGIEIMIMSIVLPIIKEDMGLTGEQLPFVQFVFNFGMFMGALASG